MHKILTICVALGMIFITESCNNQATSSEKASIQEEAGMQDAVVIDEDLLPNGTPGLARKIIDENLYIDLDLLSLNETMEYINYCQNLMLAGKDMPEQVPDNINNNIAKAKAASYRIFTKITTENNQLILAPCTAESLKMNQEIFDALVENIEQTNDFLRQQEEAGYLTDGIEPITQEYLNSLLE